MYCNTLHYFRTCEQQNGMRDVYEGVRKIIRPIQGELYLGKPGTPSSELKKVAGRVTEIKVSDYNNPGNLFCLYAYRFPERPILGQTFNLYYPPIGDSDHCLLIFEPDKFIEQVKVAAARKVVSYEMDFIRYKSMEGRRIQKDFFIKDLAFKYQNEYRIYFETKMNMPLILNIGRLTNSLLMPASELSSLLCKFDTGVNENVTLIEMLSDFRRKYQL